MTITIKQWMIYGANGYTGRLMAKEARRRGHQPILAGRNEEAIIALAAECDLPYRIFDLNHSHQVKQQLDDIGLVLHCAGPFTQTSEVMREACLESATHYLDITGEMDVLAASYACHERAREKGIVVISGVGFDVVPTDLLANVLKQEMPDATHLELAFAGDGGISPGTAITMVSMMAERGKIRRDGEIATVPLAYQAKEIPFFDKARYCMTIPWGDIATAFFSTEIANIKVFTAADKKQVDGLKRMNKVVSVLRFNWLQKLLRWLIIKNIEGPTEQERDSGFMQLWGSVTNGRETITRTLETAEGYRFTVFSSLLFVEALLAHKVRPGAFTPAQAIDIDLLRELDAFQFHDQDDDPLSDHLLSKDLDRESDKELDDE
jgi:short subunit dehydrogenase-like uncharacterized protein